LAFGVRLVVDDLNPETEDQRLRALRETGIVSAPPSREMADICERAKQHFGVAMALVTLIEKDIQIVRARAGTDLEQTPRSVAFCDVTIRSDDVLVVADARQDPRFASNPLVTGEPFIRFYAGAPLVYLQQIRFGALCLLDPEPRGFSLGDRAELTLMADEVVSLIAKHQFRTLLPSAGS
jgi:GAF domain-containing protein